MSGVVTRTVTTQEAGQRLDRWFRAHFPGFTQGRLQKLLRTGQVRVDGGRAKAGQRLEAGQEVRVPPLGEAPPPKDSRDPPPPDPRRAAALRDRVLFMDRDLLAIDKPAGLAVQGGSGTTRHLDAMLDALVFDAHERPRLVHRLDKDTSGVLILARNAVAARRLATAFKSRAARKLYWAVAVGEPRPRAGRIDAPLAKRAGRGGERVVVDARDGKPAATTYRIVDAAAGRASWLALEPLTGRTHQLRVHCATLGMPILGDGKYAGRAAFLDGLPDARRLHLHARALRLPEPDGRFLELTAPLPPGMADTFAALGFEAASPDAGFDDST